MEGVDFYVSIVGALALMAQIGSNIFKQDRRLVASVGVAGVLWAVYFHLLNAWTGVALSAVFALRQGLIFFFGAEVLGRSRFKFVASFCLVQVVLGVASWEGIGSIFPVIGTLNATIAMFYLQGVRLRLQLILFTDLAWIIYDLAFADFYLHAACVAIGIGFGISTCIRIRSEPSGEVAVVV